jgi:hypothetical protein
VVDNQEVSTTPYDVATDKVTYSGDADQNVQLVKIVGVSGAEGSKTVVSSVIHGDGAFRIGGYDAASGFDAVADVVDLPSQTSSGPLTVAGMVFNGTTWDRLRGDATQGLLVYNGYESYDGWGLQVTVAGDTQHDAPDTGKPIKIGGKAFTSSPPTVADGDRVDAWFGARGQQAVALTDLSGNTIESITTFGDAQGNATSGAFVSAAYGMLFNGSTWSRMRGDATNGLDVDVTRVPAPLSTTGNGTAATALRVTVASDTTGVLATTPAGNVAHDAADSGNPVKIGGRVGADGRFSGTPVTNDRVDAAFDLYGRLSVVIGGENVSISDAGSNTVFRLHPAGQTGHSSLDVVNRVFNGTTWDRMRGDTNGTYVGGNVAHDAVDAGNPIKIGGKVRANPTPIADGDRVDARFGQYGQLATGLMDLTSGNVISVTAPTTDSASGGDYGLSTFSHSYVFNGTLWDRLRGNTTGLFVQGHVAHDAVDAGNPIKIGGKASSTTNTTAVAANDRVDAHFDTRGRLGVWISAFGGADALGIRQSSPADAAAVGGAGAVDAVSANYVYNGTTWDRQRGDTSGTWVHGPTASDAALTVAPLTIGARASTAVPTAVSADGDVVDLRALRTGALTVHVVDAAGAAASMGGGTEYAEDAALGAAGTGALMLARRDDALTTLTPVDGDAVSLRVNATGALWVAGEVIVDQITNVVSVAGAETPADNLLNATSSVPTIGLAAVFDGTTWDRARSLDAFATASATPTVGLPAAIAPDRRFTSLALGTVIGNTQAWDVNGASAVLMHVATTQTGTMIFEVSADGTNWVAANTWDTVLDAWATNQNLVPTANRVYRIHTAGWRNLRARTVATLNGTVALTATLSEHSPIVIPMAVAPPHQIGYTLTGKTVNATTAQTGTAIWTPASGKKLVITSYQIQSYATTAGTAIVWFGASADTTYTRGTDLAIFDGEFAPSATLKPGVVQTGVWPASAVDHVLRYTTTNAQSITITVWGYEA